MAQRERAKSVRVFVRVWLRLRRALAAHKRPLISSHFGWRKRAHALQDPFLGPASQPASRLTGRPADPFHVCAARHGLAKVQVAHFRPMELETRCLLTCCESPRPLLLLLLLLFSSSSPGKQLSAERRFQFRRRKASAPNSRAVRCAGQRPRGPT